MWPSPCSDHPTTATAGPPRRPWLYRLRVCRAWRAGLRQAEHPADGDLDDDPLRVGPRLPVAQRVAALGLGDGRRVGCGRRRRLPAWTSAGRRPGDTTAIPRSAALRALTEPPRQITRASRASMSRVTPTGDDVRAAVGAQRHQRREVPLGPEHPGTRPTPRPASAPRDPACMTRVWRDPRRSSARRGSGARVAAERVLRRHLDDGDAHAVGVGDPHLVEPPRLPARLAHAPSPRARAGRGARRRGRGPASTAGRGRRPRPGSRRSGDLEVAAAEEEHGAARELAVDREPEHVAVERGAAARGRRAGSSTRPARISTAPLPTGARRGGRAAARRARRAPRRGSSGSPRAARRSGTGPATCAGARSAASRVRAVSPSLQTNSAGAVGLRDRVAPRRAGSPGTSSARR